eukprot:TRINITY_DN17726_c0_g1_i1.p2 TRINITY_DN17726_c0_g1~~TRINITY_DN17726_c0_g1_i1.p2  ORF type:complete len:122 (+),score=24.11 TRINITY_DN17726_c0_g1_i1:251-616(+)
MGMVAMILPSPIVAMMAGFPNQVFALWTQNAAKGSVVYKTRLATLTIVVAPVINLKLVEALYVNVMIHHNTIVVPLKELVTLGCVEQMNIAVLLIWDIRFCAYPKIGCVVTMKMQIMCMGV